MDRYNHYRNDTLINKYKTGGITMRQLADEYGITYQRVQAIISRTGYKKPPKTPVLPHKLTEEETLRKVIHRFWSYVSKVDNFTECWEWMGCKDKEGYGRFNWSGKIYYAHQACWIISYGHIPDKICILHKCDNPTCVNPYHLYQGTQTDNMRDREERFKGLPGGKYRNKLNTPRRIPKQPIN